MNVRFNPARAALLLGLAALWVLWTKLAPQGPLHLPRMEPLHALAGLAMICITIVAIVRLALRGK